MYRFDFVISNGYQRKYLTVKAKNSDHAYYKAKNIAELNGYYIIN